MSLEISRPRDASHFHRVSYLDRIMVRGIHTEHIPTERRKEDEDYKLATRWCQRVAFVSLNRESSWATQTQHRKLNIVSRALGEGRDK